MAMNRIQFQPGLSLTQFLEQYGTEERCEQALEQARWPEGYRCEHCASTHYCIVNANGRKTYQYHRCHHQSTLKAGTIFHASKLPLVRWFQAMYLMSQSKNNISGLELKRQLGVCYRTAWLVKHKLMQVMREREADCVLGGRVIADDAYLGGERRGKRGRGSENKVPFIAAIEVDAADRPLRVRFDRVEGFCSEAVSAWAKQHLAPQSTVISDGLACFAAVTTAGCHHEPQVVGATRRSTDMPCFSWVNTLLGNLKTALSGTYHAFNFRKYADRYLAEYQYRFNRRVNLKAMLPRLLRAAATTGSHPETWLRMAELHR
jgi:hypothetical protein